MNFDELKLPSNKTFGYFFSCVLMVVGLYQLNAGSNVVGFILLFIAGVICILTILNPTSLSILNKLWMQFGIVLGVFFRPIILGVIYFGFFTPIGVLAKLLGRDELKIKFKTKPTYWRRVIQDVKKLDSFKNQF